MGAFRNVILVKFKGIQAGSEGNEMAAMVSTKEAAVILGVTVETVRDRLRRGELVGQKVVLGNRFVWLVALPIETLRIRSTAREKPKATADNARLASDALADASAQLGGWWHQLLGMLKSLYLNRLIADFVARLVAWARAHPAASLHRSGAVDPLNSFLGETFTPRGACGAPAAYV
jgi:hypothetical protein